MTSWPAPAAEAAFHGPAGEFVARTEPHSEAHPMALLCQFLVGGLSSGEGLIAQVRDPVDQEAAEPPSDKRRLVVEPEFAQPLKVLAREGNTLSAVVRRNGTLP